MRVLLISSNTETVTMPVFPLGLHLVAEASRLAGHEVQVLDLLYASEPQSALARTIEEFQPQAIGISVRNIDDQSMSDTQFFMPRVKEVIDLCRRYSRAPVILGGAGYSIYPRSGLDYLGADMGIKGEGEEVFPLLLHRLEQRQSLDGIPNLYRPQGKNPDAGPEVTVLDRCPLLAPQAVKPFVQAGDDLWMPYQTRRGCSLDCSYCSTGQIEGRRLRKRPMEQVTANLKELAQAGVHQFFIVDNTFNLPASYARAFCRSIRQAGLDLSWRCIIYPNRLNPDLVQDMAQAGCQDVSLGFESGSSQVLANLNKKFSRDDVRHDARLLAEHGIKRLGFLLLGGPGETKATVEESLDFAQSLELDALKLTVGIRIYPHTDLARRAQAEGLIAPDDSLLFPRFYLRPELDGWLQERVAEWAAHRPELVL